MTEIVRVESADSHFSAMAGVKTPPQGTGNCVCEIMFYHIKSSDHDSVPFLQNQSKVSVEHLAQRTKIPLQEGVCISSAVAVVVYVVLFCIQQGMV